MLRPAADAPAVVVCSTCRHSREAREDGEGLRGGERLARALAALREAEPRYQAIDIQPMPCLFACSAFCTVHLRAPGKIGYVLGRFTPDPDSARAILDYALAYAASAHGQVPYAAWPEGVKGHFLVRVPPPGFVAA